MTEADIPNIKCHVMELFSQFDDDVLETIEKWFSTREYRNDLQKKKKLLTSEERLEEIAEAIKKLVPFEAEMSSEDIIPPTVGDQADCNDTNTCHVDEFLYDELQVTKLAEQGKIKRHYCLDCNSRNVEERIFISHSMSKQLLQYIFTVLLPKDMAQKQILDVGSRLGAVLYGAYYFSNALTILGIEMNKDCCDVQEKIINQFDLDRDRIKVIHSDVMERPDILENSHIVVINVLDFFVDIDKHRDMWYFFKRYIKRGSYLVTNRSMVDTLNSLDIYEQFMDWLAVCKPCQPENEYFFDVEDYSEVFLYTVN